MTRNSEDLGSASSFSHVCGASNKGLGEEESGQATGYDVSEGGRDRGETTPPPALARVSGRLAEPISR
jgi:hypothetical protein